MNRRVTAPSLDDMPAEFPRPRVSYAVGGAMLKLRLPNPSKCPTARQAPRGIIHTFTRRARKRLLELVASLNRDIIGKPPLMITLTYHNTWPATGKECKAHLSAFCKRIIRRFKDAAIIWKLEYQKRGAPHFHLLVFGCPFIARETIAQAWGQVAQPGDDLLLQAGTRVERVRSWGGAMSYAAKYLGKIGGKVPDEEPGRFWGVVNRAALPITVLVRVISWDTAYRLRRIIWRSARGHGAATGRKGHFSGASGFIAAGSAIDMIANASAPRAAPLV